MVQDQTCLKVSAANSDGRYRLGRMQSVEQLVIVIHQSLFRTIDNQIPFFMQKNVLRGDSTREFRVEFPLGL